MSDAIEVAAEVAKAWAEVDAPPENQKEYFTLGGGRSAREIFRGVSPILLVSILLEVFRYRVLS